MASGADISSVKGVCDGADSTVSDLIEKSSSRTNLFLSRLCVGFNRSFLLRVLDNYWYGFRFRDVLEF